MAKKHPREQKLQKDIKDFLLYNDQFVWVENNAGIYNQKTKGFIPVGLLGKPDIMGMLTVKGKKTKAKVGIFLGIELKNTKYGDKYRKYQSPHQRAFEKRCKECGGIYLIGNNYDKLCLEIKGEMKKWQNLL